MGLRDDAQLDFRQYGILDWLAERAEQLGFSYPTGEPLHVSACWPLCLVCTCLCKAHAPVRPLRLTSSGTDVQQSYLTQLQAGKDCLLQAPTGSGKTLAFLLPTLSRLDYTAAGAHARQVQQAACNTFRSCRLRSQSLSLCPSAVLYGAQCCTCDQPQRLQLCSALY